MLPRKSSCVPVLAMALALVAVPLPATEAGQRLPVGGPLSLESGSTPTVLHVKLGNSGPFAVDVQFHHGKSREDAVLAHELLGGARADAQGQWVEPGVPAQFRVRIARIEDAAAVFEAEVNRPPTRAGYRSRWARLAEPRLAPGVYRLEVSGSSTSAELRRMRMEVFAQAATHGK